MDGRIRDLWQMIAVTDGHADLVGVLVRKIVEAQGRHQTDDAIGNQGGGHLKVAVFGER